MAAPILTLACALACAAAASAAAATPRPVLGSAAAEVGVLYPRAHRLQDVRTGATILEIAEVDLGGVHWDLVDLVFDARDRLDHVQLTTRTQTFEQIKTQITARYDDVARATRLVSDPVASLQLRLCDHGTAGVVVTWERPSQAV